MLSLAAERLFFRFFFIVMRRCFLWVRWMISRFVKISWWICDYNWQNWWSFVFSWRLSIFFTFWWRLIWLIQWRFSFCWWCISNTRFSSCEIRIFLIWDIDFVFLNNRALSWRVARVLLSFLNRSEYCSDISWQNCSDVLVVHHWWIFEKLLRRSWARITYSCIYNVLIEIEKLLFIFSSFLFKWNDIYHISLV